jgi:P-type E1-E2 ATPase
MIQTMIPGVGNVEIAHLLLDVNGTLTTDGVLIPGVERRVARLHSALSIMLVTADTRGTASALAERLGIAIQRVPAGGEAQAKADLARSLGAEHVAAIGNGANDALMLKAARIGIAVLGNEGLAVSALQSADLVTATIVDALDLLVDPVRLLSTLRH